MLTPEQMEEAVEAMAMAINPLAWKDDIPVPTRADTVFFHTSRQDSIAKALAALTAALPVIERAVLERAARHLRTMVRDGDYDGDTASGIEVAWLAIDALAGEVR